MSENQDGLRRAHFTSQYADRSHSTVERVVTSSPNAGTIRICGDLEFAIKAAFSGSVTVAIVFQPGMPGSYIADLLVDEAGRYACWASWKCQARLVKAAGAAFAEP
ncbi:unnamed protein product [Symbiodinium necroappetens]|uniref:Uncharacterized protein n=1 Tax=Symbiodinium necroappetens TaxID=1628268 RepID=A0A813AGC1_9DINO|nr:unnamed protein product [Symbiodinium necroappetens]